MEKRPSADAILSGHEMTVKGFARKEEAVHVVHMAVDHIAGTIGMGEVIDDGKEVGLETELENGIQSDTIRKGV